MMPILRIVGSVTLIILMKSLRFEFISKFNLNIKDSFVAIYVRGEIPNRFLQIESLCVY